MFDYVVVGAGSAGCVLAHRLSADGKRKVALLEAGGAKHASFGVRVPGLYQTLWWGKLDWGLTTEPQVHCDGRRHYWPRGKLLGGTSCLNAMVYIRGNRANYDGWGIPGWRYDDVLPYFKRSEDNSRGASHFHGVGGPLAVRDHEPSQVGKAFVAATAARYGVPVNDDFNGVDQEGVGYYQATIRDGARHSTAAAFLAPARGRGNLTVITGALATAVVVDGTRVTGVRVRIRGREQTIEGKEIVLTGGAIGSPQLLLLSGIGPADELRDVGVEPRHALAGVGKHLEDHLLAAVTYECTASRKLSAPGLLAWSLQALARKGPLVNAPLEAGAFLRSHPDAPLPDVQFHVTPWGVNVPTDTKVAPPWGRCASFLPGLIYPRSHGEIRLRNADPSTRPVIDPRYFSNPTDLDHLVAGVKVAREIAATAPLVGLLGREIHPGPDAVSDDAIRAHVRATCNTIFHPTGTCKMGTDPLAVVDPELRVHGLHGLRVADVSILPSIIGGNTNAPAIMVAEKAADLLLE